MADISQSDFLNKFNRRSKGAFDNARKKKPKVRGRSLPGGLEGVIGRVTTVKLGETQTKGDPYVIVGGSVVEPEDYQGYPWSVFHMIAETEYTSIDEAIENLCSDLQFLGIETSADEFDERQMVKDLNALAEEKPLVEFNTWKGNRENSKVRIYLEGIVEEDAETPFNHPDDEEAENDAEPEDDADDDAGEEIVPELEDVVGYAKSPRGKPRDCEVVDVDEDARTVDLVRLDDEKEFPGVSWDKLVFDDGE
jgi:hypothetical protein